MNIRKKIVPTIIAACTIVAVWATSDAYSQNRPHLRVHAPKPPIQNGLHYPFDKPKPKQPAAELNEADCRNCSAEQLGATDQIAVLLGQGYNSFTQQMTGNCVNGYINGPLPNSSRTSFELRLVRTASELKEALAAEAAIGGGFASFQADASAKLNKSSESTSNTDYLVARVRVFESPNITLRSPVAQTKPENNSPEAKEKFFGDCGDNYIRSVEVGGEFLTMFSYEAGTQKDKQDFEAKFSASGWGFSASASMSKDMEQFKSKLQVAADYTRVGGVGGPSENTIDSHIQYAVAFPKSVTPQNAALIGFSIEPYRNLRIPAADYADVKRRYDALEAAKFSREAFYSFLLHVKDEEFRYNIGDIHAAYRSGLQNEIRQSEAIVNRCAATPSQCNIPPQLSKFEKPEGLIAPMAGQLPVTSGNQYSSTFSNVPYHWKLFGRICFAGDQMCFTDGIGHVEVELDGKRFMYNGPISINPKPGQVTVLKYRIIDSDYSDNTGTLYSVNY